MTELMDIGLVLIGMFLVAFLFIIQAVIALLRDIRRGVKREREAIERGYATRVKGKFRWKTPREVFGALLRKDGS